MMSESEVRGIVANRGELAAIIDRLEQKVRAVRGMSWEEIQYALSQITEEKDKGLYGLVCYYAAFYMMNEGRQDECLCYLNESIRCMTGTEQECQLTRCYNILGLVFQSHNNLIGAMEQNGRALFYAGEYGQLFYQCLAERNMADSYYRVGNYERAVGCYRECIRDIRKSGVHTASGENAYRKILAGYGYCLLMTEDREEARTVVEEIHRSIHENKEGGAPDLAVDGFLTFWYYKNGEMERADYHIDQAMQVIVDGCMIVLEYDRIMNLIQMLIMMERFECLQKILNYLEPQALIENNEGFLLQLRLFRLQYCSVDMDQESFVENMHSFFCLKDEFENAENCQIPRLLSLRSRLDEIEQEQKRLKKEKNQLLYQTEHDELSGLYNKRSLNHNMEEIFEEALYKRLPLGVLFVDIDYFKQMNDRYGHQKGDDCIVAIAQAIKECMPDDFAARYGGDEFVILTQNQPWEYVVSHAQMLVDCIREKNIPNEDSVGTKFVTVTVGGAYAVPHKHNKMWDFLATADQMLYEQKKEQKGLVRFYTGQGDIL